MKEKKESSTLLLFFYRVLMDFYKTQLCLYLRLLLSSLVNGTVHVKVNSIVHSS